MLNKYFIIFSLFLLLSNKSLSQENDLKNQEDSVFIMQKSPTIAMLKSALIPGWGQFYNDAYWKIPVVWGFLGYYFSVWISQNDKYNFYKKEYYKSINSLNPEGDYQLKKFRDFYHNQRDEFTIYIFLTYFLNIIDAYVDAHLFDFNVNPDLSQLQMRVKINF